jgi:hypothetical protein
VLAVQLLQLSESKTYLRANNKTNKTLLIQIQKARSHHLFFRSRTAHKKMSSPGSTTASTSRTRRGNVSAAEEEHDDERRQQHQQQHHQSSADDEVDDVDDEVRQKLPNCPVPIAMRNRPSPASLICSFADCSQVCHCRLLFLLKKRFLCSFLFSQRPFFFFFQRCLMMQPDWSDM